MIAKRSEEWVDATCGNVLDSLIYDGSFRHVYLVVCR